MESAGELVTLAWEVMRIDGVFRTGSIMPVVWMHCSYSLCSLIPSYRLDVYSV